MSELLLHWLNNELQLSTRVTAVERDFASGYLLGELLQRLNQQHNLSDFMDNAIADAKIINFCLLEPTLRRMGVRFDARAATAIMNSRAGAAADLLYQIKMAADRIARAPRVSTKSDANDVPALHNAPPKLAKPSYDAAHHYFFEHSVRRQVQSLAALQNERDAVARERQRMRMYRAQQAQRAAQLEAAKAERLHQAFLHSAFIKTALDETDSPAWRRARETKRARERRQAQFQRQLAAERAHKADAHTFSLRRTVETDLDAFERRGSSGAMSPTTARKSHGYGLRSLSTTLERQATLRDPSQPIALAETGAPTAEQLEDAGAIREQQQHRARRREQLGRRRKRFLQDALHAQSHSNAARAAGELETLVGRATHREAEATQAVAKILVYKEIAAENRLRRDESYAARREMDAHEAIDRDAGAFELLFAQYNDDWELQGAHAHARRTARAAAQQHENALVAAMALHELLALAMVAAAKREDAMHARDADDTAFLASDESWDELRFQFAARGVESLAETAQAEAEDALLRHQLDQYLACFWTPAFPGALDYVGAVTKGPRVSPWVPGDWKFVAAEEILEDRFVLGETVKYLRWLTHAAPPATATAVTTAENPTIEQEAEANSSPTADTESTPVPQEEDQVVLTEPPPGANEPEDAPEVASGEAVLEALRVAEPEENAMNQNGEAAVSPPPSQEETQVEEAESLPPLPRLRVVLLGPPFAGKTTQAKLLAQKFDLALLSVEQLLADALAQRSALGQQALEVLATGGALPPRQYSELVVDALSRLDARHRDRWVLFDLPPTVAHAQSLEAQLSGFVEPARVASPFDLASPLAPGCAKPRLPASFLRGKSGVDRAFYLACAEETALERCLGALEDRETREKDRFHLLLAPPPADATDRHRLQHVNATTNASALLALQCLTVADGADATTAWFARFATLRAVATTERHEGQSVATTRALTPEATHARLVAEIDAFMETQRDLEDAKARDRELDEANEMEHEEARQRALAARKQAIQHAQDEVARAQLAVQQAEEAKAKKEELAELRGAVDAARKQLEGALVGARDWKVEEALRGRRAHATFSAKLLPPLARVLAATWDALEHEYSHAMTCWLRLQRQQRARVEQRVQWLVDAVCRVLRRADARQRLVDAFQTQFNGVEEAMRFEDAAKRELHARADVLQDALCELVAAKRRGSEDALREMMGDGWQEDACQWLALAAQRALQVECDRFRGALQLLVDAFVAASDEPALLAGAADALTTGAGAALLGELTLKVFVDASEEQAAAAAAAAAATPAPAANAKGGKVAPKGKPPLASVASVHAGGLGESALTANPLAVDTLLLAYDLVVQKSEAIVELVVNAPPRHEDAPVPEPPAPAAPVAPAPAAGAHGKTKTGATPVATPTATPVSSMALLPRQTVDVATSNFHKAVRYEQELLARRVAHLKDATQSACERVARTLRATEATLSDAIAKRAAREDAAVASLVAHVRAAIERETDLPFYINVQPEHVYRFPITAHLLEDTRVVVDARQRLVGRAPEDPPPRIEPRDAVVLNARQASELRRRLQLSPEKCEETEDDEPTMTVIEVVAVLLALANEPHALPSEWQRADEAALVEVVAAFADVVSGLVDTRTLVDAMAAGATLLVAIRSREPLPSTDATDAADAPQEDHGDVAMKDGHEGAASEC